MAIIILLLIDIALDDYAFMKTTKTTRYKVHHL